MKIVNILAQSLSVGCAGAAGLGLLMDAPHLSGAYLLGLAATITITLWTSPRNGGS